MKVKKVDFKIKEKLLEEKNKTTFSIVEVIIITIIALLFGGVVGSLIFIGNTNRNDKYLEEFINTYTNISEEYYKKVNKDKLINAAIEGMVSYLGDPYSIYMDEEDTEVFNQTVDGEYEGVGVTVSMIDQKPTIVSIFDNSPAKEAGIKAGDIIVKVNGKSVDEKTLDEVIDMIKEKDKIKLTILRDENEKDFNLNMKSVVIPSVSNKIIEKNNKKVGIITVSVFAGNTYSQFNSQLKKLEKKGIDSLVIDVRDNPGGHLDQVSKILSLFLDKDKVIYQIKSNGKKTKVYSSSSEKRTYPIGVLINSNSASASEILAGAMQESYKATIVGIKSYGKGTVQKEYSLNSGSSIKYTTESWLTPSGKSINKKGITPDLVVELSDEYIKTFKDSDDNQLQAAIDAITK